MPGTLSHELPLLRVSGNHIVQAGTREPILLRGVVRSGLEYSSPDGSGALSKAGITVDEILEMIAWGSNIIRLPFNQDWTLRKPDYDPEPYLKAIDFFIDTAASLGAYTLLDLQWLDATTPRGTNSDGTINFVPPLPDDRTPEAWVQIAARYSNETAVLYDIFNEPHDALPDDWNQLLGICGDGATFPLSSPVVSMSEWQPWARYLVGVIRDQNPNALIFVPGIDWAYDLRGFPLLGLDGIVYSTHVYRNKGNDWGGAFGDLGASHPVFAAEWGGGPDDVQWGQKLEQYLRERNIGWTAWSWSDKPYLVQATRSPNFLPTAFGSFVKYSLKSKFRIES
jgi:endoglucanase